VTPQRVAITGARGQVGSELVRAFTAAGHEVRALARPEFDLLDEADLEALATWEPDLTVNAAAWTDVDGCALDPDRCSLVNGRAAGRLAERVGRRGGVLLQLSTNEVFDGTLERPYTEEDVPSPINPYGEAKLLGERLVREAGPQHIIVRTAWIFGGSSSFPVKIAAAWNRARETGAALRVVADEFGNPTPAAALADRIVDLWHVERAGTAGLVHLAGQPPVSRIEWARQVLGPDAVLEPIALRDYVRASRPPLRALLAPDRAQQMGLPIIEWRSAAELPR
jgi:dTDP-4-dehydrorhamnose reductase